MTPRHRLRRERLGALVVVILAALALGLWHPGERAAFWKGIEGHLLDARFVLRGPLPAPPQVAIVAFDDAAIARLATFPPSRSALATVVEAVWARGARVLALDFLLIDPRDDDPTLAAALARGDTFIAVAEAAKGSPAPLLRPSERLAVMTGRAPAAPLPALGPAAALQAAAGLGHATVEHDADGALRRMRPVLAVATSAGVVTYPGLAVAAVAAQAGPARHLSRTDASGGRLEIGPITVPLDLRDTVPLDFYGPAGSIPTISATSVAQADLRGKTVFLGATAIGFGDRHATPFEATLPGVELHATFAANLLEGRTLRRDALAWAASAGLAMAAAIASFAAAGLGGRLLAALATGAVIAMTAAALQGAFLAGWWLDATTVLMGLALGALAGAALLQFQQRRRATNLARYQPPALVETLATSREPMKDRPPQHAVVLFVDVADFTPNAEAWGPQRTHAFLALFTRLVEETASRCHGMIADFAGDGALVVFGVPEPGRHDTEHALQFIDELYGAVRATPEWPGLRLRVSGHAGPVQLGVLGGEQHRRVSVSGDVVNTASRLQDCARASGTSLALSMALLSGSPAAANWAGRAGLRHLPPQALRGRSTAEEVYVGEPALTGEHAGPI